MLQTSEMLALSFLPGPRAALSYFMRWERGRVAVGVACLPACLTWTGPKAEALSLLRKKFKDFLAFIKQLKFKW